MDLTTFLRYGVPALEFAASFIPGAGPVVKVLELARPYLGRIEAAAPAIKSAIENGTAIYDAVSSHGPALIKDIKTAYAILRLGAVNPELAASTIPDRTAVLGIGGHLLMGRPWTAAEEERFFAKATGDIGAIR